MEFGGILHEKIEEEKPGEKGGGDGKVEEAVFEVGVQGEAMNVGVALAEEASRAVVAEDKDEVALAEDHFPPQIVITYPPKLIIANN